MGHSPAGLFGFSHMLGGYCGGQAGVDVDLTRKVFLNLDVKYTDIDTTARLQTTAAGTQQVKLHLDPLVVGVGLGFRL